jgi:hypothetical protein
MKAQLVRIVGEAGWILVAETGDDLSLPSWNFAVRVNCE